MSLDWIYYAISWILLRWHALWDAIGVPDTRVLGTNWAWVLSIFFLVVTLRVILFPVFVKQIKSQRAMQALQPKVKQLQEKHKGDRETLQKEMMELYKVEKANPLMGCLPMFLQIPVFLGLFHVLRRLSPTNTQKTLYGWTVEQFDSATHASLFTAPLASKFRSTTGPVGSAAASVLPRPKSPPVRAGCTGFLEPFLAAAPPPAGRVVAGLVPAIFGGGNLRNTHCCWPRVKRLFVTQ